MPYQTIRLVSAAPAKPPPGEACNGCGVCCAAEPCPLGRLVFRQRSGPCPALHWDAERALYRCELTLRPERHLPRLLAPLAGPFRLLALRWIAAGGGCDSDAQSLPP